MCAVFDLYVSNYIRLGHYAVRCHYIGVQGLCDLVWSVILSESYVLSAFVN